LKEGVIWRVGDGKSINILRHNWLPREMGLKIIGTLKPCRLRKVANLMNEDGRSWNLQKNDHYFYPHDAEVIRHLKLANHPHEDVLAWRYE
jgi:hypothetical protein